LHNNTPVDFVDTPSSGGLAIVISTITKKVQYSI
jgi:hypothetical protein